MACVDSDWTSLIPWCDDLISACVDLVQLESVPVLRERTKEKKRAQIEDPSIGCGKAPSGALPEPVKANDSKHPALRRAALVLLGVTLDVVSRHTQEAAEQRARTQSEPMIRILDTKEPWIGTQQLHPPVIDLTKLGRARTVIQYIEATDEDDLVRHQAMEILAIMDNLAYAGISRS